MQTLAQEGTSLSQEAFIALKREFRKRGLNDELLAAADQQRVAEEQDTIRQNILNEYNNYAGKVWQTAIPAKQNQLPDSEVKELLQNKSLSYDEATDVVGQLPEVAKRLFAKAGQNMKRVGLAFLAKLFGWTLFFQNTFTPSFYLAYVSGILVCGGAIAFCR